MRDISRESMRLQFEVQAEESPISWCDGHVDFSLNPKYPTEFRHRWDPNFLPMWQEPLENCFNPEIREQAILKCSQAGGTENVALNAIRFSVARAPRRILYVWGDQKAAEEDFKERVIGGLRCCQETIDRMDPRFSREVECRLELSDMVISGAWPKSKMAFKRNPWSLVIADEFSTYSAMTPDMIRRRCSTVPFSHILWLSSPDPTMKRASKDDPIFVEYEAGDQRKWHMPDPKTGKLFVFEMGGVDCPFGLKWDQKAKGEDGVWDYDLVNKSAHYITPDGTVIRNPARMDLVRKGQWVATNDKAPADRRSYHISTFYMPFKSGDFGAIAVAFLRAKATGTRGLKVFLYEYLAERWEIDVERADDDALYARQRKYKKTSRMTDDDKFKEESADKGVGLFLTADVQKGHHWWVLREWIEGGDSALVDWGYGVIIEDLRKVDQAYQVDQVFIDNRYSERRMEVYNACLAFRWVPTIGSDSRLALPFRKLPINPSEGKIGKSERPGDLLQVTFDTDVFKTLLVDLMMGRARQKWWVYDGIEGKYVRQVASEEKIDGEWKKKRGHPDNHLFDCEVLQLLCATNEKLYRHEFLEGVEYEG